MNTEQDRLVSEMVAHLYNTQAQVMLPTSQEQLNQRLWGLMFSVDRQISEEYYNLSPSQYKIKYGDEGPSMAWLEATKMVHKKIMQKTQTHCRVCPDDIGPQRWNDAC